jgi:predicted transcriptional regulator
VPLTVNGKPEALILDAVSYREMIEQLEKIKTIAAIKEGIAAAERGELKPAEQVFAEMKARQGLSD